MPKNRVQFQMGLSLAQVFQLNGFEARCQQAPFHARWPHGLGCPSCGSSKFRRLATRRNTFQCNRCKRQLSPLADTLFQSTKLLLTSWFLAI